ncbi:MAG: response regulator [Sphingomonas sp.]|nr:response regulator [Sphingomonas sp.]
MSRDLVHLVDDDDSVRSTLARLLRSGGYEVIQYSSGDELLASAETLKSGVVLLDINMPGKDGFAVHRALADRSIDLPVVMMTGAGDLTILALKAGASELMQKPFGRGELLAVLDQISGRAVT